MVTILFAVVSISFSGMQKIVHTMRDKIGLPSTFG
jgi:hypothetical protein